MKKLSVIFLLLLLSYVPVFSQTTSTENDVQVWNETQILVPLIKSKDKESNRFSLIFYGTLRGNRNLRLIDERIGFGFVVRANKYLTFTPSYVYRTGQPDKDETEYESRLRFDVELEKEFKHFSLKDRNRIEHRFRNSKADMTRYRNKLQLTIPVKKEQKEIFAPFVATEPFYEFQAKQWTRNEITIGIAKTFNCLASAEFFYLLRYNRGDTQKYQNVFGVNLKFTID